MHGSGNIFRVLSTISQLTFKQASQDMRNVLKLL